CGECGNSANFFLTCPFKETDTSLSCDTCGGNYICVECAGSKLRELIEGDEVKTAEPEQKDDSNKNVNTKTTEATPTITKLTGKPTITSKSTPTGRTSIFSKDENSSINQLLNKTGLSNGALYGIGAVTIIALIIIFILIVKCMRKPKSNNKKYNGERNYNESQGYNQLNDDNYSNYRSLSNPSLHKPIDNNPYAQVPSISDLPNYDSILIDDKKFLNTINTSIDGNNNNNNSSSNNNNITIATPTTNNSMNPLYSNEKASNSQSSLILKNSNHYEDGNMRSGSESFLKSSNSHLFEGSEIYTNSNRPMSKIGSSDLQYNSPNIRSQTNIDVMPMSATVTTTDVMNSMDNGKMMSPKYMNNHLSNMSYSSFDENKSSMINTSNASININVNGNANNKESEMKQTYGNMPYSPNIKSPNGKLFIYTNQNSNSNSNPNPNSTPNPNPSQNPNPLINPSVNPSINPFSDSHATVTPTNGYSNDLSSNMNGNGNTNGIDLVNQSNDISMNNISMNNTSQNFANVSINHSFKHNESFTNSPMTPKSISSLKSPSSKHQSLVTTPTHKNMNMKRATITSPTHENFIMSPMVMDSLNSSGIRSPSTPKTPKSAFTPNLNGSSSHNDSRNSIRMGSNGVVSSPSFVRPSTPSNHHTPKLERVPSGRSTIVSSSNASTPNLERQPSGKSLHSITTATPVMENIPSGMGKQTLERHHSGKSLKSNYATATLERVPSNGQKQVRKHTPTLDRQTSASMKLQRNSSQDNGSTIGSTTGTATGTGSVAGSVNGSEYLSSGSINGSSSVEGKGSLSVKSPQPKSILKNANAPNNTSSSSISHSKSQEDLSGSSRSLSLKRKKSKGRKQAGEINVPPFPSMSRKASNLIRENSGGSTASPYSENVPTTPLRPPQLTVFGHAVATPPTPKSTRFPQDAKVLPPTERATPVPPDILGGTDVIPLNTMTLQRKHFHKRNKSVSANVVNEYNIEPTIATSTIMTTSIDNNNNNNSNSSNISNNNVKAHPLPAPPQHHHSNSAKSTEDLSNRTLERERASRSQEKSDSYHYRSKSLPRPNKNNSSSNRYVEENALYSSMANSAVIYNLEQKLTSFEVEFYKENENQKMMKSRSRNSVISILHEEKRNMDYYIAHCDD
ncbi:hypothetical protein LY90DRAFT_703268, partial [Neocallimastix californiae]